MTRMFGGLNRLLARRPRRRADETFEHYVSSFPSNQNAVDAVPGWSTSLPGEYGTVGGRLGTYHDERIFWAAACYGPLEGANVLELGPLEAGHTIQLERLGARVTGIEANRLAFLRCLIAKEIVGLRNARFKLGDFTKWLEEADETYDFIVASGVLYHLRDPLHFLDVVAKRSKSLFLWTHFVEDVAMPIGDPRRGVIADTPTIVDFKGRPMRLYRRTYASAQTADSFSGGMVDHHHWMHRDDILAALEAVGFTEIQVSQEQSDHQNGPCFSVFARRD